MRRALLQPIAAVCSAVALIVGPTSLAPPTVSAATVRGTVAAAWLLNDGPRTTTMADFSGHGLSGRVSARAASEGLDRNGSRYHWSGRCPGCLPVQRARVVKVPDSPRLEIPRPRVAYTLAVRFRTHRMHPGNMIQKGHATAPGGQIKVQATNGSVQCLFTGADGVRVGTGSGKPLNNGRWHVVRCVHFSDRVVEFVDGTRAAVNRGSTGPIDNDKPLTIGGKLRCDQVSVTCDYYSGSMDWIKISHG